MLSYGSLHWSLLPVNDNTRIPNLLYEVYKSRPDLQAAFPGPFGANERNLLVWAQNRLALEYDVGDDLIGKFKLPDAVLNAFMTSSYATLPNGFFRWALAPANGISYLPALLYEIWKTRPDLQRHFPNPFGYDQGRILVWAQYNFASEYFTMDDLLHRFRITGDMTTPEHASLPERLDFPKYEDPLVSILLSVHNEWSFTYACLASIYANTRDLPYEVIIADGGSTDETVNITEKVSNIIVVRNELNRGFLRNCNQASSFARRKYLVFLKNTTQVQEGWLSTLVHSMEINTKIGLVGGKQVYPDGKLREAGSVIWQDGSCWHYGRFDDMSKPEYNYVKRVDYVSGACIMIRTDIWNEIHGFDDRFAPTYYEDVDLCFEVRKSGYDVVYNPKCVLVDFEDVLHSTEEPSEIEKAQIRNQSIFVEKWKKVLEEEHLPNGMDPFLRRDRSIRGKTVLVIDHYVPQYDRDAGGRSTYLYLKLLVESGLNVKFIGDIFMKHEPYTSDLQSLGIEVLYGTHHLQFIREWLRENGQYIDYVMLCRPLVAMKYIDDVRRFTSAKVIYYGLDLHFVRERRKYDLVGDESLLRSAEHLAAVESMLFEKCDVVYYPSQEEVDIVKQIRPSVTARAIPVVMFEKDHKAIPCTSFSERIGMLFVGGFAHHPNVDAVLWFTTVILPMVKASLGAIDVYVVGSNPPPEIQQLDGNGIHVTGYVSDQRLADYYRTCRLCVAPLRYGAGVKGKVVEAIFHCLPIVTTGMGAEGLPEAHNYLVVEDDPTRFAGHIIQLYNNPSELQRISNRYGDYISRFFSVDAARTILSKDIAMW